MEPEKVFISSTCYDLTDLRAELREHLLSLGLVAVVSDAEDFRVEPIQNSIETCLVRLRESDIVLVVLDSRYGPSLGAGFGNVSATHLEYLEARKLRKPMHLFIRDRVRGAMAAWKKASDKDCDFLPVKAKDVSSLFPWIEQHENLAETEDGHSNWTHTFTNSVDLRAKVSAQLEHVAERAFLLRGLENATIPRLAIWSWRSRTAADKRDMDVTVCMRNQGANAVSNVILTVDAVQFESPIIGPGEERQWKLEKRPWDGAQAEIRLTTDYESIRGARLRDEIVAEVVPDTHSIRVVSRRLRLLAASTIELGPPKALL